MKADTSIKILRTATQVFYFLKQQGGLDDEFYDKDIIADLRTNLALPNDGDFCHLLRERSISIEGFLVAFFQAVQPYAEMMSDLLAMFERAGAKQSGCNLAIEFDFTNQLPKLKFDLEHFRQYLQSWNAVTVNFVQAVWDSRSLWDLLGSLEAKWDAQVHDPQFRAWIYEYREVGQWPAQLLPPPQSKDPYLDVILSRSWKIWSGFVSACKQYGAARRAVVDAWFRPDEVNLGVQGTGNTPQVWPLSILAIESDLWAGSFARAAYYHAERIASLSPAERREQADVLCTNLERVIAQVPKQEIQGITMIQQLMEFLNLPIWQRRHELYSAWVSTQILDAIPAEPVRIHTMGDKLVFAFSGTHLSTADAYEPRLHVWAELRSPLEDPRGKSRTASIQPDYSLVTDPITNPEASILEVECKQYRRPSVRNFSDALTDYARGRPNAIVVLVNYGETNEIIGENILKRVDQSVRDRTFLIGNLRPGSIQSQERFRQLINEAINKRYPQPSPLGYHSI